MSLEERVVFGGLVEVDLGLCAWLDDQGAGCIRADSLTARDELVHHGISKGFQNTRTHCPAALWSNATSSDSAGIAATFLLGGTGVVAILNGCGMGR